MQQGKRDRYFGGLAMAYKKTEKLIKYNNDYNKENYERINLFVKKGRKSVIKAAAGANGESVNAFINRAIDLLLEEEQE